jgi:CHAD domain-containing protein
MRFELNPRGQPDAELRRIGEALIRDAIEQVEDPTVPPDGAVHEARKNMKKLRGMLRLIRPAAPGLYKAENRAFRDAAARLAVVRDAKAALETFDSVLERARADSQSRGDPPASDVTGADASALLDVVEPMELASLRKRLLAHRDAMHAPGGNIQERLDEFRVRMLEALERISDWRLPKPEDTEHGLPLLARGLKRTYRRGRKAMTQAYEDDTVEAFHEWRKRAKYLGYHLGLLRPGWPKLLKEQEKAVKALQRLLGEDHDLAVLAERLNALGNPESGSHGDSEAELALRAEMSRQSRLLRRRARGIGELVFAEQPKAFRQRVGTYWRHAR